MAVPEDIRFNGISAAVLGHGHEARPHLGSQISTTSISKTISKEDKKRKQAYFGDAAGVVNGSGDDEPSPAIDDEGTMVIGDIGRQRRRDGEAQQGEEDQERGGAHRH